LKDCRIGKDDSTFYFGIVCGVLAGDDADLPIVVINDCGFGMYGGAAVVEHCGDYLEGHGAY